METIVDYIPFENQKKFHDSKVRFRSFIGGIGSGKTLAGCQEALRQAIKQPGSVGVIIAPTYRMLNDVTKRTFFEICPKHLIKDYRRMDEEVTLINNSRVWFRSATDPEKLRGPNITWFYIDEASLVAHMVWKIMIGRIRQKGYNHMAWITTTPKGFNWIWEEFVKKQRPEYFMIVTRTMDNPYLPKTYIKDLQDSYSGVFLQQELHGEFVALEGAVYPDFSRLVHVFDYKKIKPEFKEIIGGIDPGFTNPTGIVIMGIDGDGRYYVIDEFYERKTMTDRLIHILKEFSEKYKVQTFYCDPSEPELIQRLNDQGIFVKKGITDVMTGIMEVSKFLKVQDDRKPRLFVDKECINTIMEFENYVYPEQDERKPIKEMPLKMNDHLMDAIRYIIMSRKSMDWIPLEGGELIWG